MTKNDYSIRVLDPDKCSDFYSTIDVGRKGGMRMSVCIPQKDADKIKGEKPTRDEWRRYGVTQRYLIPKKNAEPCFDGQLCGTNWRGWREIDSLETMDCVRVRGKKSRCKVILKDTDTDPNTYSLISR